MNKIIIITTEDLQWQMILGRILRNSYIWRMSESRKREEMWEPANNWVREATCDMDQNRQQLLMKALGMCQTGSYLRP